MWIQSYLLLWSNAEQGAPPCTWWMRTACIWTFSPRIWSSVTTTTRWVGERIEAPRIVNCSVHLVTAGHLRWHQTGPDCQPATETRDCLPPGIWKRRSASQKSWSKQPSWNRLIEFSTLSEIMKKQQWWCYPMSVWLGGAPQFGGGKLMREDLVVITVEYRSACEDM